MSWEKCSSCGHTNETVENTEFGVLCDSCYLILSQEHFDIIDE